MKLWEVESLAGVRGPTISKWQLRHEGPRTQNKPDNGHYDGYHKIGKGS